MSGVANGTEGRDASLVAHLSGLDIWALALGCAVGWGAFVMPASTLIPLAGAVGTVVALGVGALAMVIIASCYAYLAQRYPDAGGALSYTARTFGHDHAFLCGWTVALAYIAVMWANATSVVLIARFVAGPLFQVGYCWTIAGYDVYLGEIAVTNALIVGFALVSCLPPQFTRLLSTFCAVLLLGGAVGCAALVFARFGLGEASLSPAYASEGNHAALGVLNVAVLAPWAYVGFESVSHATEELKVNRRGLFRLMMLGLVSGFVVYAATTLMSVLVVPESYEGWVDYFADLGSLKGYQALPVFHAVAAAGGDAGLAALYVTVLGAISSSLLGLYRATSRLIYGMAREGILRPRFAALDAHGTPRNGVLLVMAISVFVPFAGRAAIGWIVDVTSISAAIAYLYVCACASKLANERSDQRMVAVAHLGIAISVVWFVFPLVPNFWSVNALAPESYLILSAWAVLGLLLFWLVFRRDRSGRFGKSTVVWIALLFLIFFSSTMWMRQATEVTARNVVVEMGVHHENQHVNHGVPITPAEREEESKFVAEETKVLRSSLLNNSLLQMGLIAFGLTIMFNIYTLMGKRQTELEAERLAAEEAGRAKTMFLSNVSHDLRTPMNAIVGYTRMAKKEGLTLEETRAFLDKIDGASAYMLSLVNDVLEMGRIESGRMQLTPVETDLRELMADVTYVFEGQMQEKGVSFTCDTSHLTRTRVLCDRDRLNSVMLNLLSNALKFTPAGGQVSVSLAELGDAAPGVVAYELCVRDTGIGMSEEFQARIFEPFEREQTSTVSGIQGTGLGMSITKSIVEHMGGEIHVSSQQGAGSEFVVLLPLALVDDGMPIQVRKTTDDSVEPVSLEGRRVLVVEDNEINREIACALLEDLGLEVDEAENGQVAVERVAGVEPGYYDAILMDVQMPVLDGYGAARRIRSLADARSQVPIVAVTANAFVEDVQAALNAGMDAHLSKPLDIDKVEELLGTLLS